MAGAPAALSHATRCIGARTTKSQLDMGIAGPLACCYISEHADEF